MCVYCRNNAKKNMHINRIELVFEFISKTEFLISRIDFLREESDLFNPRL